jgi:hypothetical protein
VGRGKTDWVVAGGRRDGELAHCNRCGAGLRIALPESANDMADQMARFTRSHTGCLANPRRFTALPSDLDGWLNGPDTGPFSLTIVSVMVGSDSQCCRYHGAPREPRDFARCQRLLTLFPQWRDRLEEVAKRFPEWGPMVKQWDLMAAMYKEEGPAKGAPRLATLMHDLERRGSPSLASSLFCFIAPPAKQ